MNRPIVTVLGLGGTIAMTPSAAGGVVPALSAEALVAAVPGLGELAQVEARSFRQMPGAHLLFQERISDARASGTLYVDFLTWAGTPHVVFTRPEGSNAPGRFAERVAAERPELAQRVRRVTECYSALVYAAAARDDQRPKLLRELRQAIGRV